MVKKTAMKPPMGWNSWDCFGASVREDEVRANAEFIANNLKKYGWHYVTVDIQWSAAAAAGCSYHNLEKLCMDEYGRLIPAPNRFPSSEGGRGFGPLADYVHSLGLGFGIHIMRGIPRQAAYADCPVKGTNLTARDVADGFDYCPWNMDMYGVIPGEGGQAYYDSITELYASWGVDFIKCDDLAGPDRRGGGKYHKAELAMLRRGVEKTGRPIVISSSPGTHDLECADAVTEYADMWRISGDLWDNWRSLCAMDGLLRTWNPYMKPGAFPDADMLPLGKLSVRSNESWNRPRRTSFTREEQRFMMSLWAIARSPLIIGGDLRASDDFTMSLLTCEGMIDCDQNSTNNKPVALEDCPEGTSIWTADAADGGRYVALLNLSDEKKTVSTAAAGSFGSTARDVWTDETLRSDDGTYTVTLAPHEGTLLHISR
jgi:hypothetical protein